MEAYQKDTQGIRLFRSDFCEWFSHVHPSVPLIVWTPILAWLFYRTLWVLEFSFLQMGAAAFGALMTWSLVEYGLHRFLFHYEPRSAVGKWLIYLFHGNHHDDPQCPTRLVMPPIVSIVLATIFYHLFKVLVGPVWIEPFFAFFICGYLIYDYTHFAVHHFTPRTRIGKWVKQNHMNHHFVTPDARFGVSSPLWDWVFRSQGPKS